MSKPSASIFEIRKGISSWYRQSRFFVRRQSENENVFHCTVQKSASQWILAIVSDERVYRYSGLVSYQYTQELPGGFDPRKTTELTFDKPFPPRTLVTPLYIGYESFKTIPKPRKYKAFFVMRDPRDLLISWYFSAKYSHPLVGPLETIRQELHSLDLQDGLLYAIDYLECDGLFKAQHSWAGSPAEDPNVMLVKYEDLIGPDNAVVFRQVLKHCDIRIPDNQLKALLVYYSFENLSGRKPGQEDQKAHYRKGIQGDWKNYFNDKIQNRFIEATGDLLAVWGY